MSKTLAAGLVIYRKNKELFEYLLLQTSRPGFHWTPPKGHLEPGEDLLETALRETEEESGLKKEDLRLIDFKVVINYEVKGKPKEVTYWLAEYIGKKENPVVLSFEHQDFRWSTLNQALEYVEYDNQKSVLRQCEEFLRK